MGCLSELPLELLHSITLHLSLRDKARYIRTHRNAKYEFYPGHIESIHIWDKIFKSKSPWIEKVLSLGMYPVLVGRDLVNLDRIDGDKSKLPYIALVLAQPEGCQVDRSHTDLLLSSLCSNKYSVIDMEVYFPGFTLHVGNILHGQVDLADPGRLLEEESNVTRLVLWKGRSTEICTTKALVRQGYVVVTCSEGDGLLVWVFFRSTSEPSYRRFFGRPRPQRPGS